jgi:hypothetical protein
MTRTKRSPARAWHAGAGREGKVIMTSKRVFGILAVIALVALSATGAQAGHGGTPTPLTSFFMCKSISGEDANQSVDVDSTNAAGWGFVLNKVRLGKATLACAFIKLFPGGSTHTACDNGLTPPACNEISPNPDLLKTNLKCYALSVTRGQIGGSPPPSYTMTDELVGEDPNVTGSSLQYICAPANILQNLQ